MSPLPPPTALNNAPWTTVQVFITLDRALHDPPECGAWAALRAAGCFRRLVERGDFETIRKEIVLPGIGRAIERLIELDVRERMA